MQDSNLPAKVPLPFATDATPGVTIRTIPLTSSDPNAASYTDGFPLNTMTPEGAGGQPPDGRDFNDILFVLSGWAQWQASGGPVGYDAVFSGQIGGYQKGSVLAAASPGFWWYSTVDNNTSDPDTGGSNWTGFTLLATPPGTGAQIQYSSATQLLLAPMNGGVLWINGYNYTVPASLTLANTGLASGTKYYIYAFLSGSTVTLEASTTGYTLATNGMPQKAGDATRTCVGMVFTTGSSQFSDTNGQRWVLSYFNRGDKVSVTQFSTTRNANTTTLAELNAEIRSAFLVWAGASVKYEVNGSVLCSTEDTSGSYTSSVGFDGIIGEIAACSGANNTTSNATLPLSISSNKVGLSEGEHYLTLLGATGGESSSWVAATLPASSAAACSITLTVQG
jgi:hypothetical protein